MIVAGTAGAQGTRADYERANSLPGLVRHTVFRAIVEPHWFAGDAYRNEVFWSPNSRKVVEPRTEAGRDHAVLFPNPWSVEQVRWEPDSRRFTFLYNQRGHQVPRVVVVDGGTGEARAVVDERSKTSIDYASKLFVEYLMGRHWTR